MRALCRRLQAAGWLAFDTEFVGEDQYRPEVCLIQVAIDGLAALIDPLGGLDVKPFWELIADEGILVLVHAGSEDICQCWHQIGQPPRNVFDLQIAAGMVGLGYPKSLSRLARETTGRRVRKSQTLTDWRKRPLSDEQISYAIADVTCLRPMYEHIHRRLVALGREVWAREECEALCDAVCHRQDEEQWLVRLKGVRSCSGQELAIARALVQERAELAQRYNRPVRGVLKDHLLVEIARHGWTSAKRIQSLRGVNLNSTAVQRLAEAVRVAKQQPPESWPELLSIEDSAREEVLLSLLSAVLREHCRRSDLAFSLVGKKQQLRDLVRSYTRPDEAVGGHVFSSGWRKAAVGELLEDILRGERAVRVCREGEELGLSVE